MTRAHRPGVRQTVQRCSTLSFSITTPKAGAPFSNLYSLLYGKDQVLTQMVGGEVFGIPQHRPGRQAAAIAAIDHQNLFKLTAYISNTKYPCFANLVLWQHSL